MKPIIAILTLLSYTYASADLEGSVFSAFSSRISDTDYSRGYVLQEVLTNEVFDFTAPATAGYATNWLLRGASSDYRELILPRWPFPIRDMETRSLSVWANGNVSVTSSDTLPNVLSVLGLVPEYRWDELPDTCAASFLPRGISVPRPLSVFWYEVRPDSFVMTWQNALLDRSPEKPVGFQLELIRNGNFILRFDLHSVPSSDAVFSRLASLCGTPLATSLVYHRLHPLDRYVVDRDGDRLTTESEIFDYHTDPGVRDTDGDGLIDGSEVSRSALPLLADTDGDGYSDGTDPHPDTPTSWTDDNGDGLPDAWTAYWFGAGQVDPHMDPGEDGIDNIASLRLGINPKISGAGGFSVTSPLLPANVNAFTFVPTAFSFSDTNNCLTLVTRTNAVYRVGPWQQLFISSSLERAEGWAASDVEIGWSLAGASGTVPTNTWDSYRLPLGTNDVSSTVVLTLRVTGGNPSLNKPLYLLRWTPALSFSSSADVGITVRTRKTILVRNNRAGQYLLPYGRSLGGYPHCQGFDEDVLTQLDQPMLRGLTLIPGAFQVASPYSFDFPQEGVQPSVKVVFYQVQYYTSQ